MENAQISELKLHRVDRACDCASDEASRCAALLSNF